MALSYANLALAYHKNSVGKRDMLKKAEEYSLKAVEIRKRLSEERPELWADDLAGSYINLGALYYECDWVFSKERAPEEYIAAESIFNEVYKDADDIRLDKLIPVYNGMAAWHYKAERYDLSKNIYHKLIDIQEEFVKKNKSVFNWQLIESYAWLGRIYLWEGNKFDAEITFEKAIKIGEKTNNLTPGISEMMLRDCYIGLSKVYKSTGRQKAARRAEAKAQKLLHRKW